MAVPSHLPDATSLQYISKYTHAHSYIQTIDTLAATYCNLTQSVEAVAVVTSNICVDEDRGQRGCVRLQGACGHKASLYEAADFVYLHKPVLRVLGGTCSYRAGVLRLENSPQILYSTKHGAALQLLATWISLALPNPVPVCARARGGCLHCHMIVM